MSYNIDSIVTIYKKDFAIGPGYEALADEYDDRLPEISVFADGWNVQMDFWWSGEGSGSSFDIIMKRVLASFDGEIDLVVTWEGGDSFTGLRLRNHVVTEHEVTFALGKVIR